jgi:hypothetical protein
MIEDRRRQKGQVATRTWVLSLLWPIAFVAGCSSNGGASSPSGDQTASDAANALCARLQACSPVALQFAYGDVASCEARLKAVSLNALSANGSGLTPARVEACTQAIPGASCDDGLGHNFPPICQPVAGQLADGTACFDSSQCQTAFCHKPLYSSCGTCGPKAASGASCYTEDDCSVGNECFVGKCVAPSDMGGPCDLTMHPCKPTLGCKQAKCATPAAVGESCTSSAVTDVTGNCDPLAGLYCDPTSSKCVKYNLAPPGQPCGILNGHYTTCSGGSTCSNVPTGMCLATLKEGAACSMTTGAICTPPAVCQNKVCTTGSPSTCH